MLCNVFKDLREAAIYEKWRPLLESEADGKTLEPKKILEMAKILELTQMYYEELKKEIKTNGH